MSKANRHAQSKDPYTDDPAWHIHYCSGYYKSEC